MTEIGNSPSCHATGAHVCLTLRLHLTLYGLLHTTLPLAFSRCQCSILFLLIASPTAWPGSLVVLKLLWDRTRIFQGVYVSRTSHLSYFVIPPSFSRDYLREILSIWRWKNLGSSALVICPTFCVLLRVYFPWLGKFVRHLYELALYFYEITLRPRQLPEALRKPLFQECRALIFYFF